MKKILNLSQTFNSNANLKKIFKSKINLQIQPFSNRQAISFLLFSQSHAIEFILEFLNPSKLSKSHLNKKNPFRRYRLYIIEEEEKAITYLTFSPFN